MAVYEVRYFDENKNEITHIRPMKNAEVQKRFGRVYGLRYDSFNIVVSCDPEPRIAVRKVDYKTRAPSLHKCNAKCLNGKPGGKCECSCGGKNHGAG